METAKAGEKIHHKVELWWDSSRLRSDVACDVEELMCSEDKLNSFLKTKGREGLKLVFDSTDRSLNPVLYFEVLKNLSEDKRVIRLKPRFEVGWKFMSHPAST